MLWDLKKCIGISKKVDIVNTVDIVFLCIFFCIFSFHFSLCIFLYAFFLLIFFLLHFLLLHLFLLHFLLLHSFLLHSFLLHSFLCILFFCILFFCILFFCILFFCIFFFCIAFLVNIFITKHNQTMALPLRNWKWRSPDNHSANPSIYKIRKIPRISVCLFHSMNLCYFSIFISGSKSPSKLWRFQVVHQKTTLRAQKTGSWTLKF